MPIYEYRCSSCGHELEALQKFSDAPLVACPSCSAMALVKKVSAAGFQLKGSGWYATDFKGGGAKPRRRKTRVPPRPDRAAATDAKASQGAIPRATPRATPKSETKRRHEQRCGARPEDAAPRLPQRSASSDQASRRQR